MSRFPSLRAPVHPPLITDDHHERLKEQMLTISRIGYRMPAVFPSLSSRNPATSEFMEISKKLLVIALSTSLMGCEGYRQTVRNFGSAIGAITIRDIQQAQEYRNALPGYLGLQPKQVQVEAGSGATNVTIVGVSNDLERQRIANELLNLNSKNPQLNPLRWNFE